MGERRVMEQIMSLLGWEGRAEAGIKSSCTRVLTCSSVTLTDGLLRKARGAMIGSETRGAIGLRQR